MSAPEQGEAAPDTEPIPAVERSTERDLYALLRGRMEPTGVAVSVLVAALTAVAVYAFGAALARVHPALAAAIHVVAVVGFAPTLLRYRYTLVLRWVIYGLAAGIALGWIGLLAQVL